jgi:hypothetical protein
MRNTLLALMLSTPLPLAAQGAYDATYVVQQGGKEVGRERIVLRPGQGGANAGTRVELEGRYANSENVRGVLTRGADGAIDALQLEVRRGNTTESIRAAVRGNRVFITTNAQGARGGRELPADASTLLLDDQLITLLALVPGVATPTGTRLSIVYPRTGKRGAVTATRSNASKGSVIELTGDVAGRMTLDAEGHIERIELANGTVVTRLPS